MINIKIYKNKKGVLCVSMHANLDDLKSIASSKSTSPSHPILGNSTLNPMSSIVPLITALKNPK